LVDLLKIRERGPYSGNSSYADPVVQTGGIVVDEGTYGTGADTDRRYNVKGLSDMFVKIINETANSLDLNILATQKEYDDVDADLVVADFTQEVLAEVAVITGTPNLTDIPIDKPKITAILIRTKETTPASATTYGGIVSAN